MIVRAYITHKQAELFSDCQDRFGVNSDTKSIALSDGMSQSWHQKIWAQLLVDTFVESSDWLPDTTTIKPLCSKWREKVVEFISKLKERPTENLSQKEIKELTALIYRNERNLVSDHSAGATIVGIRFNGNNWYGTVLGDSCLIEWNGLEAKFYTSQEGDLFDSHPDYFDSDASKEGRGFPKAIKGELTNNNILFLVSDPFSEFLLEHSKKGDISVYVKQLIALSSHDEFEKLVSEWRDEGMHNDDTTLIIVEHDNTELFSIDYADNIDEMIEKEKTSQSLTNDRTEKELTLRESPPLGRNITENFIVAQNDEKYFINEFMTEYQRCLQKKFPRQMGKLKFRWTQKAVEEALNLLLERYSVTKK